MTYRDIYMDVARRCDKAIDNPDPVTEGRLNNFINDRYRELLRIPGVMDLRDDVFEAVTSGYAITSTANENRLTLPPTISAVTSLVDNTNRLVLAQKPLAWIRQRDPSQPGQSSGTPRFYAILNMSGVIDVPSAATANALEIRSTSGSDIGGVVSLEYADERGAFRVVTATLNGAAQVLIPVQVSTVFRLTVDTPQVGAINLNDVAAVKTLASIPPNTLIAATSKLETSRGWVLWLWPTPAGAYSYTVDGTRQRTALVGPTDEPLLPEDFHTLLVWGACADELLKMDDTRVSAYEKKWSDDVKALRAYLHQARGQRLVRDRSRRTGWSPLGSQYPPWQ